jgi:hypothetical protein
MAAGLPGEAADDVHYVIVPHLARCFLAWLLIKAVNAPYQAGKLPPSATPGAPDERSRIRRDNLRVTAALAPMAVA